MHLAGGCLLNPQSSHYFPRLIASMVSSGRLVFEIDGIIVQIIKCAK